MRARRIMCDVASKKREVVESHPWRPALVLALAMSWIIPTGPLLAQPTLPCAGDCDAQGSVSVNELVTAVNIALGALQVYRCPLSDVDGSDTVTIPELISAVGNALYDCPTGELAFDVVPVAMIEGGQQTVVVRARDGNGNKLDWTVEPGDPTVVSAEKNGDAIELTSHGPGSTGLMVTTQSELRPLRRSLPVRVYDPMVLDAGELLIRYVDTFQCLPPVSQIYGPGSFYRAVIPQGWFRLGSFGVPTAGCPDINGQQWMMIVKPNPDTADPDMPPVVPPTAYNYIGGFGDPSGLSAAFWDPQCPSGYVDMGGVEGTPEPDDAACVREDLTVPGVPGPSVLFYWATRTAAPENIHFDTTTTYLETGAFSGPVDFHPSLNVLAVQLPLLVDNPQQSWLPRVTSFLPAESQYSEPMLAKAMLVPFTAILGGRDYVDKGVAWMVANSPFVRVERVVRWQQDLFAGNSGSSPICRTLTLTKGLSSETSTTISHKTGVSLAVETGVKFLGAGSKITATVSYEFGYQTQHSVGEFEEQSNEVSICVAPHKAGAAWRAHSTIVVKLHDPVSGGFQTIVEEPMFDSLAYFYDDYPD
jgi:hypothetical protein